MSYHGLLHQLRATADKFNVSNSLMPYFSILESALPHLERILKELRGDKTTCDEFQESLEKALASGDYSAKNVCSLMHYYARTHNSPGAPGNKPVVAFAQEISKMTSYIDDICFSMKHLEIHGRFLRNIVIEHEN